MPALHGPGLRAGIITLATQLTWLARLVLQRRGETIGRVGVVFVAALYWAAAR